ncbi:hypothetical protein Ddye_025445 [Dipteronia dyeriana]|uniref:Endonuclease/exonuclease/phosphatase domain-containing protein n=1 Tax=Dipteronia dyeriana TaxID=168575 RepID=A0AAD9WPL3_9ROSI|nr:hypothetical protein Ddye_025445 [Dipteronia dyeriana]
MLVLSWNVRGLGRGEKCRAVKNLVTLHNPTILFIQESKLRLFNDQVVRSLGGLVLAKDVGVEAIGSTGGLISLWNANLFKVIACISNQNCVSLAGELVSLNKKVVFCNVYASNVECDRKALWDCIIEAQVSLPKLWCIGGDFNAILVSTERRWGSTILGL